MHQRRENYRPSHCAQFLVLAQSSECDSFRAIFLGHGWRHTRRRRAAQNVFKSVKIESCARFNSPRGEFNSGKISANIRIASVSRYVFKVDGRRPSSKRENRIGNIPPSLSERRLAGKQTGIRTISAENRVGEGESERAVADINLEKLRSDKYRLVAARRRK